jgi:hypothetical protein
MQVLPQCGHAVHEDVPDKVAEVLATFMIRHMFAEPESNFERFVLSFRFTVYLLVFVYTLYMQTSL